MIFLNNNKFSWKSTFHAAAITFFSFHISSRKNTCHSFLKLYCFKVFISIWNCKFSLLFSGTVVAIYLHDFINDAVKTVRLCFVKELQWIMTPGFTKWQFYRFLKHPADIDTCLEWDILFYIMGKTISVMDFPVQLWRLKT